MNTLSFTIFLLGSLWITPSLRAQKKTFLEKKYLDTAVVSHQQGLYETAIFFCQKGLSLPRLKNMYKLRFNSLLAAIYSRRSMSDSTMFFFYKMDSILTVKQKLIKEDPQWVEFYYYERGVYYLRIGDKQQAFNYLNKSLQMAANIGDKNSYGTSLLQIGNHYATIREYESAIQYYKKSITYFKKKSIYECWGNIILGNGQNLADHPKEGYKSIIRGTKLYQTLNQKSVYFEIEANYYKGQSELKLNLLDSASTSFQRCIEIHSKSKQERGELIAYSWLGLAKIARIQNNYEKALKNIQYALISSSYIFNSTNIVKNPDSKDIQVGKAIFEALQLKGELFWDKFTKEKKISDLQFASDCYFLALDVAQRIRHTMIPQESKFFFNEKAKPCVEKALKTSFYIKKYVTNSFDPKRVFEIFQNYQSIALTDILHEKSLKEQTLPRHIVLNGEKLKKEEVSTEQKISIEQDLQKRQLLKEKLNDVQRHIYQFEEQLALAYPQYYALRYDNKLISINDFRKNLDPQTVQLSYFWGEESAYVFLVTSSTCHFYQLPVNHLYEKIIALRRALVQNPTVFAYNGQQEAQDLYQALIQPLSPILKKHKRLVIVRDDMLNYIPFEVLESGNTTDNNRYLGYNFAISYGYNIKLIYSHTQAVLPKSVGFAPFSTDSLFRNKGHDTLKLLKYSASEVYNLRGQIFINSKATKKKFLEMAPNANLLYLATHAYSNDKTPGLSSVFFYPDSKDSVLTASELANLPLDRLKLTILSACEGNAGQLHKSEGLISLARAFRLSGCPTIITTSWAAYEETVADIGKLFQKYLFEGESVDMALYHARLDYFSSERFKRFNHPYYWANFIIIGDPNTSYINTGNNLQKSIILMIGGCILIFFFIFYWNKRTKKNLL